MSEEMRKEFEDWIISNNKNIDIPNFIMKNDNGAYVDHHTAMLWIGWKASREAMKPIKLPDATFETPSGDNALREDAVIDAIYAAGYKVAP